jgi:hypothetical protein
MITITPAIRRMIGNHGEPLDHIRPIDSNGYAILEEWNDPETTIEIFAIIDHSGWKRELAPMEVSEVELHREPSLKFIEESAFPVGFGDIDALTGRATASLTFEHGPAHVPGLLIRIENEMVGTYYLTAEFGPGYHVDPETGERSPHVGPIFIATGNTLTANYSLKSHTFDAAEPYFPCEDIHFAHGLDYFG